MNAGRSGSVALGLACLALVACGGDGGGPSTEGNEDLFSTDGFEKAVNAVSEEAGDDAQVLQIQITQAGADFKLEDAEGVRGLIYTGGELQEVQVDVVGPVGGEAFPLADVDPEAIDRIVDGVDEQAGEDTTINAIALEQGGIDGELGWTINALASDSGASSSRAFRAAPDGTLEPGGPAGATTGP